MRYEQLEREASISPQLGAALATHRQTHPRAEPGALIEGGDRHRRRRRTASATRDGREHVSSRATSPWSTVMSKKKLNHR
jgi:hypothetical protein